MVIVNKLILFVFIFCILYVLKQGISFIFAFRADREFDTKKGKVWLFLGLALSYIITIISTGFNLF